MIWFDSHLGIVLTVTVTLVAAIVALQERRTPQATIAWLMSFVLLPYVAIPLFLVIGARRRPDRFPRLRVETGREAQPPGPAQTFRALGAAPASGGNALTLHAEGRAAFDAAMRLVAGAEERLDVMFYLVSDDAVGAAFVDALAERAREGIEVRLVIDSLGGGFPPRRGLAELRAAGGRVVWFSPLRRALTGGHPNLRNHRKLILADGRRVFSGGRNVGEDYMGPEEKRRWADLSYVLEGPAAAAHRACFRSIWAASAREEAFPDDPREPGSSLGDTLAQLVPSGPDMAGEALHDGLVQAIHAAQERVWIATPYFLPTEHLAQALSTAAQRGLDVRILLPRVSNHPTADLARGAYVRELSAAGARVLMYEPGMLHAKAGLLDEAAWVGSANFDVRSMLLNFEMTLFLYDRAAVQVLEDWFAARFEACTEADVTAGPARRLLESLFRLGSPEL